jgi:hypothetical protein
MAACIYCKTDTQVYNGGVPICLECSEESPRSWAEAVLLRDLAQATKRAELATANFSAVARDIPSVLPHPDGVQLIRNASGELSAARDEVMKAHNRLNDFLNAGILPEDLKRSG